jgi:hypothetical protein
MAVPSQTASVTFFLRLTLSDNAEFAAGGLPVAGDLTQTAGVPSGNVVVTLFTAAADGDTSVEWLVIVGPGNFTTSSTLTVDTSGVEDQRCRYCSWWRRYHPGNDHNA